MKKGIAMLFSVCYTVTTFKEKRYSKMTKAKLRQIAQTALESEPVRSYSGGAPLFHGAAQEDGRGGRQ